MTSLSWLGLGWPESILLLLPTMLRIHLGTHSPFSQPSAPGWACDPGLDNWRRMSPKPLPAVQKLVCGPKLAEGVRPRTFVQIAREGEATCPAEPDSQDAGLELLESSCSHKEPEN